MEHSIPACGNLVNHYREVRAIKIPRMGRKTTKAILWENIKALMLHHWKEINLYRLANDAGIGLGGASRLKAQKTETRLSTIEKVANVWKLEPWQLLLPGLDPGNTPVFTLTEAEKRLYERLKRAKAIADGEGNPQPSEPAETA